MTYQLCDICRVRMSNGKTYELVETEDFMSKKKKRNKMNDQVKEEIAVVDRKVIGTNPDGTPIYEETDVFAQTAEHTGEVVPT